MRQDFWKKVQWAIRIFREDLEFALRFSYWVASKQLLQELWQEQAEIACPLRKKLELKRTFD